MARNVQVKGLQRVQRNLQKLGKQGEQAFRAAMYAEGLHIMRKSVKKAPAVTGRLRNSHWVSHPSRDGDVEIGFAVIYAAAVEFGLKLINAARRQQKAAFANMNESGWKKSRVGGPGFFRGAINETNAGRVSRVARTAKRLFNAGVTLFKGDPGTPNSERAGRQNSER